MSHQIIFSAPPDFPFSQAGIKHEHVSQVCVTPPRATAREVDPYETTPMPVSDDDDDGNDNGDDDNRDTDATTTTMTPMRH
jgi:hypothetical protein